MTTETLEDGVVIVRAAERIVHPKTGETIEAGEEVGSHEIEMFKYT